MRRNEAKFSDYPVHRYSLHNRASATNIGAISGCEGSSDVVWAADGTFVPFFPTPVLSLMQDLDSRDTIHQLEQRHDKVIAELDALNNRLEQVLSSLSKPAGLPETADAAA